ncbi:DsbA family protein [Nocardia terpenica]|uniref:Serine/threonine protein kinase n=1 Tax=Nocardia terpenica TaxID=455432 RepID=A0A291RRW5_9NOCA|nr:thioredoxin domain-containing protein [Nocardia terpenica]ATL69974.1 serine/threonine protein kinase [Nocardia terpenica]
MSSRTTYALGGVALAVIVLIVVFVVRWNSNHDLKVQGEGYGPVHDPAVSALLDSDGAIVLGKPNAPKTIDMYEDPMCPACGSLEHLYGQQLAQQVDAGKLAVRYRLVNFLDPKSGSKDYSTRAVAANECVADNGDGPVYSKFHTALFTTKQPSESGGDLSNDQLSAIAKDAGAPPEVLQCIAKGDRVDSARNHTDASLKALRAALGGKVQTPSVFDGAKEIDVNDSGWLAKAAS